MSRVSFEDTIEVYKTKIVYRQKVTLDLTQE